MTYDDLVELTLGMPETEESLYFKRPAVKRRGKAMFVCTKEDVAISVKLDWITLVDLARKDPSRFFQTPHQYPWPWMTVRLAGLDREIAHQILQASWEDALPGKKRPPGF